MDIEQQTTDVDLIQTRQRIQQINTNLIYAYQSITRMQKSIEDTRKYIAAQRREKAQLIADDVMKPGEIRVVPLAVNDAPVP